LRSKAIKKPPTEKKGAAKKKWIDIDMYV
jgi:hypothetical protein